MNHAIYSVLEITSFLASFSPCENPDDHSSCGSGHAIPTFSFLFWTPCHNGGVQNWNPALDTIYPCIDYRDGKCYAHLCFLGFLGILLCGFPCLMSFCILLKSGSPCEPILLMALLMYDSMHATLLHMLICATPTFS